MRLSAWVLVGMVSALTACAASTNEDQGGASEGAVTNGLRAVDIIVSAQIAPETYEARSYPTDDQDRDGRIEFYRVPIYKVFIDGTDAQGVRQRREWNGLRFMPYLNDPSRPNRSYKTMGWVNAGLRLVPRKPVPQYKPDYEIHNRFSEFGGAFVVKGTFYIHAGPADLSDKGWGSAGCVEIIGNFDDFKAQVVELSGSKQTETNAALAEIVRAGKLFVSYESARAPNIKTLFSREEGDPIVAAGPQVPPEGEPEGERSPGE